MLQRTARECAIARHSLVALAIERIDTHGIYEDQPLQPVSDALLGHRTRAHASGNENIKQVVSVNCTCTHHVEYRPDHTKYERIRLLLPYERRECITYIDVPFDVRLGYDSHARTHQTQKRI